MRHFPTHTTLNCQGRLISLARPMVMGILNLTPDSFSDGGQYDTEAKALARVEQMLLQGAQIIDVGGYSSRPGAIDISPAEELKRIEGTVRRILLEFPEAILSIDTFRASVAKAALDLGAHMINDISAGMLDTQMLEVVAGFRAAIVLMHMQGNPQTMQKAPTYTNVTEEVCSHFVARIKAARAAGISDILVDPGFGFGKSLEHNWQLFRNLEQFNAFGCPLLVGISRKSMVYRLFDTRPNEVIEITTALHLKALEAGAAILRVHDVQPAYQAIQLHHYLQHGAI